MYFEMEIKREYIAAIPITKLVEELKLQGI
jgi:hypothetical protein